MSLYLVVLFGIWAGDSGSTYSPPLNTHDALQSEGRTWSEGLEQGDVFARFETVSVADRHTDRFLVPYQKCTA